MNISPFMTAAVMTVLLLCALPALAAVIEINDIDELQLIGNGYPIDGNYVLGNNIDARTAAGWDGGKGFKPIGSSTTPFTGTFDGANYTITYLIIDRAGENYIGLFGYTSGANIKNVVLETSIITGAANTGGLAGYVDDISSITNCHITARVTGTAYTGGCTGYINHMSSVANCYSTDAVSGGNWTGGFAGYINETNSITHCYSTGNVTAPHSGGFVGQNFGNITHCYSTGNVTGRYSGGFMSLSSGGSITHCYSIGNVTATNSDGFVHENPGGSITGCYWDTESSGRTNSAAGTGKTTAEMKQQATFSTWDFISVWNIDEDISYPYFQINTVTEGEGEPVEGETLEDIADTLEDAFDQVDSNSDGSLSIVETAAMYPNLSPTDFDTLDLNDDSFLTLAELQSNANEGETNEGESGYAGCNKDKLNVEMLPKLLGDWLLIGLAMMVMAGWSTTGHAQKK